MGILAVLEKLATTASCFCNGDLLRRLAHPFSVLYSAQVLRWCSSSCSTRASMAPHIPVFLYVCLSFLHSVITPGFQDQTALIPWKLGPCSSSCPPRCSASHKGLRPHTATWGSLYLSPLARVAAAMGLVAQTTFLTREEDIGQVSVLCFAIKVLSRGMVWRIHSKEVQCIQNHQENDTGVK